MAAALLSFLAACAGAGTVRSDSPVITLQRTSCFGKCPIYRIAIYNDGTVTYEGEQFVRQTGQLTATIGPDAVRQLVAEAKTAGYFELADRYDDDMMTDQPWAITSVTADGTTKTIHHYRATLQHRPRWPPSSSGSTRWSARPAGSTDEDDNE